MFGTAMAADQKVQELSLSDCIDLALKHNLNLQVDRLEPVKSQLSLDIAEAGYYEPTLSISPFENYSKGASYYNSSNGLTIPGQETTTDGYNGLSIGGGHIPVTGLRYTLSTSASVSDLHARKNQSAGGASITLTQPLLRNFWIDQGRLGILQAKNNLHSTELALKRQVEDIITQVEVAYDELIYANESVKVQEMALELAQRSLDETKKRFEVGTVAELETKQNQAQVSASKASLLSARVNLDTQQNVLKRLISDDYLAVHDLTLKPKESLSAPLKVLDVHLSWERGLSERPDLLQTKVDLENWGLQLKYDRNQLLPQLDLTGSYGQNGNGGSSYGDVYDLIRRGDQPNYFIGATLSIPLGNRVARSAYRSDRVVQQQKLLNYKIQEQSVMVQIDNAVKTAQSSYDRVQATHEASEYALAALDAEQKKLENGKSTTFEVLTLQNNLTSARSSELRAMADYNEALAELSFSDASTLERHGINWELAKDLQQKEK